ncbi:hypothetical protein [Streptomyces sp. NPDC051569]|uniref:hypothetical protein n=1 Tax=Streptomyces sp. NPDC051569 TaxID=3365661 RepID=UPI0037BC9DAF
MAVQQLNPAPRPHAHPRANPGFGKRLVPSQGPRRASDFERLTKREQAVAEYIDRLSEGSDLSVKTLAKEIADYGQCALRTILNGLAGAGHLCRRREGVTGVNGVLRWVWRTYWSRTARNPAWWTAFWAGEDVPAHPKARSRPSALSRTAAYEVLAKLGRIDPRLTLSEPECEALEDSTAEWFERGAGQAQIVQALTAGLPREVAAPYGFVRARLLAKLPPLPPPPRRVTECADCGLPAGADQLPDGLCDDCRTPGPSTTPRATRTGPGQLPPDRVHALSDGIRTALRSPDEPLGT